MIFVLHICISVLIKNKYQKYKSVELGNQLGSESSAYSQVNQHEIKSSQMVPLLTLKSILYIEKYCLQLMCTKSNIKHKIQTALVSMRKIFNIAWKLFLVQNDQFLIVAWLTSEAISRAQCQIFLLAWRHFSF